MADTQQFKVGDVVRLKAGGPAMTIANIEGEAPATIVHCKWLEGGAETTKPFAYERLEAASRTSA